MPLHRESTRPTTTCCSTAGIERAAGVIACVDSDAENIFITLTRARAARGHADRRPRLARGLREEAAARRRRPGDLAVQDLRLEMARVALHPQVGGAVRRGRLPDGGDRRPGRRATGAGKTIERRPRRVGDRRAAPPRRTARAAARAGDRDQRRATSWSRIGTPAALEQLESVFQPPARAELVSAARGPLDALRERRPRAAAARARRGCGAARASPREPGSSARSAPARATTRPTPRCCSRRSLGRAAAGGRRADRRRLLA